MSPHTFLAPGLLALGVAGVFGAAETTVLQSEAISPLAEPVRWSEIRRVIETRCLECHGGERVKSGLRFANAETFAVGGDRGPLVLASASDSGTDFGGSRLLEVIRYENPELAMPPSGELPPAERALLERWVRAGAAWPEGPEGRLADPTAFDEAAHPEEDGRDWWAYRPLDRPQVPQPQDPAWREHPVDAFVAARREAAGLAAAPSATPLQLLRRATFDLTGLPPTPAEQADFLRAVETLGFDAAWSGLVDRLLASPHYGEHQGRRWLDLVRYAQTNGYERDATKTNIWRYRDWVIRSLNADKPYDRFVIEQLAGDELFPDRSSVSGAPMSPEQAEALLATGYYRLGVWDDEPADRVQARADELADIVDTTGQVFLGTTMGCARCHDHKADPIRHRDYYAFTALFNNVRGYGGDEFSQELGGGMTRPIADSPGPGVLDAAERDARLAQLEEELARLAPRLGVVPDEESATVPMVLVADARAPALGPTSWRHSVDAPTDGWSAPAFDDSAWEEGAGGFGTPGTPGALVGTAWTSEQVFLRTAFRLLEIPAAAVLSIHHDEDVAVFLNGQRIFEATGYRTDYTEQQLDPDALSAFVVGRNVLAVACRQTIGGQYVDAGLRTGTAEAVDADWRTRLQAAIDADPDSAAAHEARGIADRSARLLSSPVSEPYAALVVSERGGIAPGQRILLRGRAHAPGEPVEPDIPEVFRSTDAAARGLSLREPAPDAASTGRRLAFARWLVGGGAFLSARVAANRVWQSHFGRGLCRSPGDFGRLGSQPTHPELLDHLACELVARDWSLKALHRYLMSSQTYCMASTGDARSSAADPRNDLYWRFDPRRLSAEEFRDGVLATDGRLSGAFFGPGVYAPMPPEVLATASRPGQVWGRATGDDAVRRSVYVFVKRSLRLPLLESLDQPDPDLPCPERFPTNVPTQALITLNGEFVYESAGYFAARLEEKARSTEARVERGVALALGRPATRAEIGRHVAFVEDLCSKHGLDASEALRLFCLALYNGNEFLWVD